MIPGEHEEEQMDMRAKYLHGYPQKFTVEQKFKLILRLLRRDFPADYPIRVRRQRADQMGVKNSRHAPLGWCYLVNEDKPVSKRYYVIRINKSAPWYEQFQTILHEWAHALTWHEVQNGRDHGDSFHRSFGKLYRAYVED